MARTPGVGNLFCTLQARVLVHMQAVELESPKQVFIPQAEMPFLKCSPAAGPNPACELGGPCCHSNEKHSVQAGALVRLVLKTTTENKPCQHNIKPDIDYL